MPSSSSIPLSAMAEQIDDMGLWLPLEFLDDDMFAAAEQEQMPPAMGFSGGGRSPFAGFAPDLGFSGDGKKGFTAAGTTSPDGPSLVPSPPSTPSVQSDDEVLDLIYAVADEIAGIRLLEQQQQQQWLPIPPKHTATAAQRFASSPSFAGTGYYASTTHASALQQLQFHRLRQEQQIKQKQQQMLGGWGKQNRDRSFCGDGRDRRVRGSPMCLPSSPWPPIHGHHHYQPPKHQQQHHHQHPAADAAAAGMTAIFLNGPRKGSAGTGVFLPKTAANGAPSEPRKKSGCSTVLVPARVVQALNLNLDELGVYPRYPGGYVVDHDSLLLARRANAGGVSSIRGGQKHSFGPNAAVAGDEIQLPPEWTY